MKKMTSILIMISGFRTMIFCSGKYAAEFLNISVGARVLGIGGAFVSVANDVSCIYWNPAGLIQLKNREISFMYSRTFEAEMNHCFLGYVHPTRLGQFGISVIYLNVEKIPDTKRFGC